MNPIDISLTESVQGAGGAGFSAPIFRAGGGIDQGNATPQARGGQGMDYLAGIADIQGLDPVSSLRDAFDQEVTNTYEWITEVVAKGYDPTKMDMSDPNSKKVYLELLQRKQGLKKMRDDLLFSADVKKQRGVLVDPRADAATSVNKQVKPIFDQMITEYNKGIPAGGFKDRESYEFATQNYLNQREQLFNAYRMNREILSSSPEQQQLLDASYSTALAGQQVPTFAGESEMDKLKFNLEMQKFNLAQQKFKYEKEQNEQIESLDFETTPKRLAFSTGEEFQYDNPVLATAIVDLASASGYTLDGSAMTRTDAPSVKVDRYEILPVDSKGAPIVNGVSIGKGTRASDTIVGFKVFAVGASTGTTDSYAKTIWLAPEMTYNKHKGKSAQLVRDNVEEMKKTAKSMKVGDYFSTDGSVASPTAAPTASTAFDPTKF
jgi:hypothetical protein